MERRSERLHPAARKLVLGAPLVVEAAAAALIIGGQGLRGLVLHGLAAVLVGLCSRQLLAQKRPAGASSSGSLAEGPLAPGTVTTAALTTALLALAFPLAGGAIVALVAWPSWSRQRAVALGGVVEVAFPDGSIEVDDPAGLGLAVYRPIRQELQYADSPDARVRAVMTLRHMDARRAVPLLRLAFSHESEDVRLLAFGILEQREKRLRTRIELSESRLLAGGVGQRARLQRRLARDHWELVYGGFVSGDLEPVVLAKASEHAREALEARADASTALLLARIHLRQHEPELARAWLERAGDAGAAPAKTAPWLAEVAYQLRRFGEIPIILNGVRRRELQRPGLEPVAEFWTGRAAES
jgi:hypothetical protein